MVYIIINDFGYYDSHHTNIDSIWDSVELCNQRLFEIEKSFAEHLSNVNYPDEELLSTDPDKYKELFMLAFDFDLYSEWFEYNKSSVLELKINSLNEQS